MKSLILSLFTGLLIVSLCNAQSVNVYKDYFQGEVNKMKQLNQPKVDLSPYVAYEGQLSSAITLKFKNQNQAFSSVIDQNPDTPTKWHKTDTGRSLIASGALIGLGMYTYKDNGFLNRVTTKEQINRYLPGFENHLDDYTQFIPYAGVYILDVAGIRSKHSTLRKTTTIATGLLLNLLVIQGMKYTIAEPRPDGSANNSFPSGHTTTAFMGAHIFHKEYGDRSAYYSVGGYLLATVTGFFRQLNDRHWSSDVLVGAGLGISLTELAYYLNGLYYGDEGINEIEYNPSDPNFNKPSFLGAKVAFASLTGDSNDDPVIVKNGFAIDFEGAYFFNKYIGLGGNVGIQSFPVEIDDQLRTNFESQGFDIFSESIGNSKYTFGPFIQYPFGKTTIGINFLTGYSTISDTQVRLTPISSDDITESDDIVLAQFSPKGGFLWTTELYLKHMLSDKLYIGLYAGYNRIETNLEVSIIDDINAVNPTYTSTFLKDSFHSYNIGGNIGVMLW